MADPSAIAATASNMSMAQVRAEVDVAVLRRAMDIQASSAAQLIDSLPEVDSSSSARTPSSSDPNLGNHIDVRA